MCEFLFQMCELNIVKYKRYLGISKVRIRFINKGNIWYMCEFRLEMWKRLWDHVHPCPIFLQCFSEENDKPAGLIGPYFS